MKQAFAKTLNRRRGFTLVELLVVITIIMVLAALVFVLARGSTAKAESMTAMNRLRQCGSFLFVNAAENDGFISIFNGGNGHRESRLISIVANDMDLDTNSEIYSATRTMIYTPAFDPGKYDSWGTWGVNLDDNERLGVKWKKEWKEDDDGTKGWIRQINSGGVSRPAGYPLLADSSNENGKPRLRFGNGNDYKLAMRYAKKGPAIFLDGSARLIGKGDLARCGIESAYLFENGPDEKPTLITVESGD